MKDPFEKMFKENYQNPKPDNVEQFNEISEGELEQLLGAARAKAEGMILYSPLPKQVKEHLLAKLSVVTEGQIFDMQTLLSHRNQSPESCAATTIQRRIRGEGDKFPEDVLSSNDKYMLDLAIEHLTSSDSGNDYFGDRVKDWMNSGGSR